MQGRFEGLSETQFGLIEPLLPPPRTGPGRPETPALKVLNTILRVLPNGAKWCSVPAGEQRSPKSAAHDRPGKRREDGTWGEIFSRLCGIAELSVLIGWNWASADGMSVPGKGGGDDVDHGYKGKGLTVHAPADGNGMPLSATSAEPQEVKESRLKNCWTPLKSGPAGPADRKNGRGLCRLIKDMTPGTCGTKSADGAFPQ